MAAAAAIPLIFSIGKTYLDQQAATSQDEAMRAAGAAKLAAMRQGAQQMEQYRQGLQPQMMQAMNNRMAQYGGAQNVLSQMYGGRPQAPMGQMMPPARDIQAPGKFTPGGLLGQMGQPGPAINPGTPGGARAGANPYFGERFVPNIGFGGEMPMPIDLLRRRR